MSQPPAPIDRPKLAHWMFVRGLKPKDGATPLGCTAQTVRRLCLPFGHPERRIPDEAQLERIVSWTDGEVTAPDFYPARLNGRVGSDIQEPAP